MTKPSKPPTPKHKQYVRITITIPPDLHTAILEIMKRVHMTKSGAITFLLRGALEEARIKDIFSQLNCGEH